MGAKYWNDLASEIIVSFAAVFRDATQRSPFGGSIPTGLKNDVNIMRYVERNKQYHLTRPSYDTEFGWSELVKFCA